MFEVFKVKHVLKPESKQLRLGIFCWLMYQIGLGELLALCFDTKTAHGFYWFQISYFCASFLMTAVCLLPFLRQSLAQTDFRKLGRQVLLGFMLNFVLSYAVTLLLMVLKRFFPDPTVNINEDTVQSLLDFSPVPMLLCGCILVPVTEECLVRGVIFAPLCRRKPLYAYLVTTLLFSLMHMIPSFGSMSWVNAVENLLTYLPAGIALGWMYQCSGTVIGPIALHCLVNTYAFIVDLLM